MIIDFLTVNLKNEISAESQRAESAETALKAESFAGAEYDSGNTTINFYNGFGNKIAEIDATDFVVDGMIENVTLSGTTLIIEFNTEAGKQDIEVDLSSIFNPDNYYTKTQTDTLLGNKQNTLVSGTNIKTINNQSILGGGNIDIQGGSGSYSAGTNIDITNNVISVTGITIPDVSKFVTSADVETQITGKNYVTSGEVETQITNKGYATTGDIQNFVTSAQVETQITGKNYATSGDVNTLSGNIDTRISEVERVTSSGYNELHTDIVALSGQAENFITSGAIQNFVTSAQVETQITSKNYVTSGDVQTQITSAMTNSVYSTTIHNIVSISQADYDLLPVKDPNTLYVIINNS